MQHRKQLSLSVPLHEATVLRRISRIVSTASDFRSAIERVSSVLEQTAGARIVRVAAQVSYSAASPELGAEPGSILRSAQLIDAGRELGHLVIAFPATACDHESAERIAVFTGQQLGTLLALTQLKEKTEDLRRNMEALREDIASRKLLPRAISLLTSRYRMRRDQAKEWLLAQSRKSGLSPLHIAERLVKGHADAPLLFADPRRDRRMPISA